MGMNAADKLKSQGIEVKKDSVPKCSVYDIFIPRTGLLAHPRADDPINAKLADDIDTEGEVKRPVLVRRDGVVDGKMQLTLIDGSQRVTHLIHVLERWKKANTFKPGRDFIKIELFVGDDKAALLERLKRNSDPTKRPDSPEVLAKTAIASHKAGATDDEILDVMPREVSKGVLAALMRWADLDNAAMKLFNDGAPVGLLPTIIDLPRAEQAATLVKLANAGYTHAKGATRALNRERKASVQEGRTVIGEGIKDEGAAKEGQESAPRVSTGKGERVHPKTLQAVRDAVKPVGFGLADTAAEYADDPEELSRLATASGFVLALDFALGTVPLDKLPDYIKTAIEFASKKTK